MNLWVTMILLLTVVSGAFAAVISKNLLRSAVALGISSAALAALFFYLDAPFAGAFELSVGAGLISVLFIVVISLTESMRGGSNAP